MNRDRARKIFTFTLFISFLLIGIGIAVAYVMLNKQTALYNGICLKCNNNCVLENIIGNCGNQTEYWHCKHCNYTIGLVYHNGMLENNAFLEGLKNDFNNMPNIDLTGKEPIFNENYKNNIFLFNYDYNISYDLYKR